MFDTCLKGVTIAWFSLMICIVSVWFGWDFVVLCTEHPDSVLPVESDTGKMLPWDGVWFRRIAREGYSYDPEKMSSVAFYPLYPMTGRIIAKITGLDINDALLLTSNGSLAGVFCLFGAYLQRRSRRVEENESEVVLFTLALFPTTLYMRMGYSESTCLLVVLLAMYAMACRWRLIVIALIVGLATSARPMGVALILPFLWHVWSERKSPSIFFRDCILLLPLCVWGICLYMLYQWCAFDEPLAFVKTQIHWYQRMPPEGWWDWIVAHITLEPFWRVYDTSSVCYWANGPPREFPLFNLQFMNPILVLTTWAIVGWGAFRKLICPKEILLTIGLLGIPYFTHCYRASCTSEARYASVVFPFYIVVGHLLCRMPRVISTIVFAIMVVFLAMYTALWVRSAYCAGKLENYRGDCGIRSLTVGKANNALLKVADHVWLKRIDRSVMIC